MATDPYTFRTFAELLQFLEDGQLHQDLTDRTKEISETLTNHVLNHGGNPAAEIDLKIKFKSEKGVVTITPSFKTKLPDEPRRPAMVWQTTDGFSPQNPKQMHMFEGPRTVPQGSADVRTISTSSQAAE